MKNPFGTIDSCQISKKGHFHVKVRTTSDEYFTPIHHDKIEHGTNHNMNLTSIFHSPHNKTQQFLLPCLPHTLHYPMIGIRVNFRLLKSTRNFQSCRMNRVHRESSSQPSFTHGKISRHGEGDRVITLDVGGKEFKTLRSTVACNEVLLQHVLRAEENNEFTSGGNAIFIDRDAKHFGLILQYLRNKADNVSFQQPLSSIGLVKSKATDSLNLPKEGILLREIFVEATHYNLQDFQDILCRQKILTSFMSSMGSSNPFDAASNAAKQFRRALIAGGLGTFFSLGDDSDKNYRPATKKMRKFLSEITQEKD